MDATKVALGICQTIEGSFYCKTCDYITSHKKDFNRHLKSKKHLRGGTKRGISLSCQYCGKNYKQHSSLSRNKLKCRKIGKKLASGAKCSIDVEVKTEEKKDESETILLKQKMVVKT